MIGVESTKLDPVGLSDAELATRSNFDDLADAVNGHASPSVRFDAEVVEYQGRNLFVFRVHEFAEIPILCSKDYCEKGKNVPTLRRGACYVRSQHKPETAEIPSEEEMRELLELAIDKGVRRFLTRAEKAGLFSATEPAPTSDEDTLRKQIEDMG